MQNKTPKNEVKRMFSQNFSLWNDLLPDLKSSTLAHVSRSDLANFALTSKASNALARNELKKRAVASLRSFLATQGLMQESVNMLDSLFSDVALKIKTLDKKLSESEVLHIWTGLADFLEVDYPTVQEKFEYKEWLASDEIQAIDHTWFWQLAVYKFLLNWGIELEGEERDKPLVTGANLEEAKAFIYNADYVNRQYNTSAVYNHIKDEDAADLTRSGQIFSQTLETLTFTKLSKQITDRVIIEVNTYLPFQSQKESYSRLISECLSDTPETDRETKKAWCESFIKVYIHDKRTALFLCRSISQLNSFDFELLNRAVSEIRGISRYVPIDSDRWLILLVMIKEIRQLIGGMQEKKHKMALQVVYQALLVNDPDVVVASPKKFRNLIEDGWNNFVSMFPGDQFVSFRVAVLSYLLVIFYEGNDRMRNAKNIFLNIFKFGFVQNYPFFNEIKQYFQELVIVGSYDFHRLLNGSNLTAHVAHIEVMLNLLGPNSVLRELPRNSIDFLFKSFENSEKYTVNNRFTLFELLAYGSRELIIKRWLLLARLMPILDRIAVPYEKLSDDYYDKDDKETPYNWAPILLCLIPKNIFNIVYNNLKMAIDFLGSTSTIDESEKLKYLEQVLALTLNKPDVAAAVGEAIGGIINENDQIETSFLIWKQEGADDVEEPVAKRCRLEGIFRQQQVAPQPESSQEDEMEITPRK